MPLHISNDRRQRRQWSGGDNGVEVIRHEDVGMDRESFIAAAVSECLDEDVEVAMREEDGNPVDDR